MIGLFWISCVVVVYVYFGYPLLMAVISRFLGRRIQKGEAEPLVTILIAAYNEERHIQETIENKLSLAYPADKIEIIVISDGSTDQTDEIVRSFSDRGVRLIRQEPRAGKTSALNLAVPHATGELLVFSDANSIYDAQALKKMVADFHDPQVGYITGKMVYTQPDGTLIGDGCSTYMKYENMLRGLETRCGSIVGVDGGIDAVRKILYQPMKADQLPDFVLPLKVATQGYRIVYEPEAILKEPALTSSQDEYRMRVRVSLRAMWALFDMRHLLSIRKYGLFAFQLWSHKVLRYLCFLFLGGAFLTNIFIWPDTWFYKLSFIVQIVALSGGLSHPKLKARGRDLLPLRFLHYFLLLNLACAHAFLKFISGKKQVLWTPRKG